jgi:quinol monooxygenase YgiN
MMIKPGMMDAFLDECRKIRPLVLAEEGCLQYDYTREVDTGEERQEPVNQNRITLYERWASTEALEQHSAMPYMADFVSRVRLMRESVSIRSGVAAIL